MRIKKLMVVALGILAVGTLGLKAATTADIIFVVDESGSMSGEHAWIGSMVASLEADLAAAGVTGNRYALTGYGASGSGGHSVGGHAHSVGGGDFGTAAQLAAASAGLVISGGTEDGWQAINYALNHYAFRPGAAVNVILITDEDRDNTSADTYASTLAALTSRGALLNAVVNNAFRTSGNQVALGVDSDGNAYQANGVGGYTSSAGGTGINGADTTYEDYVQMAWATGGAGWDLNQLRAGGVTAASFTEAFVDIKVQEIIVQPVPEGGSTIALLGAVLIGFLVIRRRAVQA
jgi:hypothetical protein